jgi:hypothetical protein
LKRTHRRGRRDSKKGNWDFVKKQGATILRLYTAYEPLRTFFYLSLPFGLLGSLAILRFLYFQLFTNEVGIGRHVQSLVIGGTLLTLGFLLFVLGVLADLIASTRRLTEEALYRLRKLEMTVQPSALDLEQVVDNVSKAGLSEPVGEAPVETNEDAE